MSKNKVEKYQNVANVSQNLIVVLLSSVHSYEMLYRSSVEHVPKIPFKMYHQGSAC